MSSQFDKDEVCVVYGVDPMIVWPSKWHGENTMVIPRDYFKSFSLPRQRDNNYFLRPDRILGVFHFEETMKEWGVEHKRSKFTNEMFSEEKKRDKANLLEILETHNQNQIRMSCFDAIDMQKRGDKYSQALLPQRQEGGQVDSTSIASRDSLNNHRVGQGENEAFQSNPMYDRTSDTTGGTYC